MILYSLRCRGFKKSYHLTFDDHEKYPINFYIAAGTLYGFCPGYNGARQKSIQYFYAWRQQRDFPLQLAAAIESSFAERPGVQQ